MRLVDAHGLRRRSTRESPEEPPSLAAVWGEDRSPATNAKTHKTCTPSWLSWTVVGLLVFTASLLCPWLLATSSGGDVWSSTTNLTSADILFGIKHMSDFPARREVVGELVGSIRSRYPAASIVVVYEGAYSYPELGVHGETYERQAPNRSGLSAGRNALVNWAAEAGTEFIMILDDGTHRRRRRPPPPK